MTSDLNEQSKAIDQQIERDLIDDALTGDLHLSLESGAITVTKPGTSESVTFESREGQLVVSKVSTESSLPTAALTAFRTRAHELASDKARELGWIS